VINFTNENNLGPMIKGLTECCQSRGTFLPSMSMRASIDHDFCRDVPSTWDRASCGDRKASPSEDTTRKPPARRGAYSAEAGIRCWSLKPPYQRVLQEVEAGAKRDCDSWAGNRYKDPSMKLKALHDMSNHFLVVAFLPFHAAEIRQKIKHWGDTKGFMTQCIVSVPSYSARPTRHVSAWLS
jgi:hypothetical protein